jgi:spermidine synthase
VSSVLPTEVESETRPDPVALSSEVASLPYLFFLSGISSLIFEMVFTRMLTYTFGNTAYAVSTVLAAFLGGLASGAALIGRWINTRPVKLRAYGTLEFLIAFSSVIVFACFAALPDFYANLFWKLRLGSTGILISRALLSGALIFVPAFLMGGTLPVAGRLLARHDNSSPLGLDRIYAANTLGGAAGVLLSTYVLTPIWGVWATVIFACVLNIAIFMYTELFRRRAVTSEKYYPLHSTASVELKVEDQANAVAILLLGFLTGVVALTYEVAWTHCLSFLVGNSVYAFGLMLFVFLAGLGVGARIVATRMQKTVTWAGSLAGAQLLLGLVVFFTLPVWSVVPKFFSRGVAGAYNFDIGIIAGLLFLRISYVFWRNHRAGVTLPKSQLRTYESHIASLVFFIIVVCFLPFVQGNETTYFMAGELLRFLIVFGLMIGPAVLLGLSFPLLLNMYCQSSNRSGKQVGKLYAVNTIGSVVGSLVTGFVLLSKLGSYSTLRGAAATNVALGASVALSMLSLSPPRKFLCLAMTVLTMSVLLLTPGSWNFDSITGSYAYFDPGWSGEKVLFAREDVQSGLTSVVESRGLRVLLSNGKFQGDSGQEQATQARFALIPALFTREFNRGLVIGLGVGGTLRTTTSLPFKHIDVAELAPGVVEAAREQFSDVNKLVFDRDPRVSLKITDGRNFLLLSRDEYDYITLELTSLWISGEGDLYNQEFYELCRSHLNEHGVLQQWVALHHLRTKELLVLLNTVGKIFPHVALFTKPSVGHAWLVASASPLSMDYSEIAALDESADLRPELDAAHLPSMWSLLGEMTLHEASFRRAVAEMPKVTGLPSNFVSSDFHPYLEYQAPKGITVPYDTITANMDFLNRFKDPGVPDALVIGGLPSENERYLIKGYIAEAQGRLKDARDSFDMVQGPEREQALKSTARIMARQEHDRDQH